MSEKVEAFALTLKRRPSKLRDHIADLVRLRHLGASYAELRRYLLEECDVTVTIAAIYKALNKKSLTATSTKVEPTLDPAKITTPPNDAGTADESPILRKLTMPRYKFETLAEKRKIKADESK